MKITLVLISLLVFTSCKGDRETSTSNIFIKSQYLSKDEQATVVDAGNKIRAVDSKAIEGYRFTQLEDNVYSLSDKKMTEKGKKYYAKNLKEQISLFKDNSSDQKIVKRSNELIVKVDHFLNGKTLDNDNPNKNKFKPFDNNVEIFPHVGPVRVPDSSRKKLSSLNELKNLFNNQTTAYECDGINIVDPDPTGDSLSATDYLTRRTSEILELANSFDSVEDTFKYVRDNIKPWPAFGATQSAPQIVKTQLGTFIDKSTLLITLLRAKNIPAQYIFGDVLVDEEKLKGIWGVEGKYDLFWALSSLYEYWNKPGKGTIFYKNGKRTWLIPHAWVRIYIDGEWKVLDPSNIYYEYGTQGPAFRKYNINIDFEGYLVGKNQRGQYEKPGTIIDYLLETAGDDIRSTFGSGIGLRDLDLTRFGKSIVPEIVGIPFGTMAHNKTGCAFNQENLVPSKFIQKFSLKMKKSDILVFDRQWILPEALEKGVYTRHSAGLLGRVGMQDGKLKVYLGLSEEGSFDATTRDKVDLDYYVEYMPLAYSSLTKAGYDKYSISSAGDVYSFMPYSSPMSVENLREEVSLLKSYINDKVDESLIYAQFLRVANVLTLLQEYENIQLSNVMNTVGGNMRGMFYTYGRGGIVKDREDRPYGAVPLGTGINWLSFGKKYSRTGNFSNFTDYTNITDASLMFIIYGSHIEANIWEILYGVPGGSSTKMMHLMAEDIFVNGKENILVKNEQLGVGRDSEIFAKFNDDMVDFVVKNAADPNRTFIKYKSVLYSHKSVYKRENGFTGRALLTLPTDPRSGALALYGGVAPSPGGLGPMGGGTIANEQDAKPEPTNVDVNDTERPGASYSCNPVSHSTGDMFHDFSDFVVRGRTGASSIKFQRKYSTKAFKPLGDLGPSWTHNFQTRVISQGFDDYRPEIQGNIVWIKEGGSKVVFTRNADGTYKAPSGVRDELIENSDHIKVIRKGGNFYIYSKSLSSIPVGRLAYFEEVHGERITANYSSGRLESVESPFAGRVSFNYDDQNRISSIYRERDDLTYTFSYTNEGYLATSADFENNITKYEYVTDRAGTKAQNLLNKIIDPLNQEIAFEYYDDGRVFQEIGKGGAKSTYFYSYFMVDHLTRVRGENGATKLYKFDDEYRLIETEFEDGSRKKQVWDDDSNLVTSIDELGYKTLFIYDDRGNKIGVKAPENSDYIRTEFHPIFDKPTKVTPLLGAITVNTFDETTGDLLKTEKQDSIGSVFLEFEKDQFGNTVSTTNNETSYSDIRDENGFLKTKFDLRNPISMEYDLRGRVTKRTFQNGRILTMEYDNFDRVVRVNNNSGPDTINEYDVLGRLISKTITDGTTSKTTRFEYDSRNRQTAIIDPLGRRTEKKYDIPGLGCKYVIDKPVEIIDSQGRKTKFEFDSRNRLVRSVSPDGTVTRNEYNERGDLIAITDGVGNRSTFMFDGNRRLIKKVRPSSKSAVNGTAKASKEIAYLKYDEANRLIREEMLLSGTQNGTEVAKLVTEHSYNELSQRIKKVIKKEFMGQTQVLDKSDFSYSRLLDAPNQLSANNDYTNLSFSYENKPPFAMETYSVKSADPDNSLGLVEGEFTVISDVTGGIKTLKEKDISNPIFENEFDLAGRLIKRTSRHSGQRLITSQSYDSFGRKESITHDTGLSGAMTYDELDRIKSINYTGEGYDFSEVLTYEELSGNITKIEREIGTLNLTYDKRDQLKSVAYSGDLGLETLLDRTLTFDRSGNRTNDSISGEGQFIRNAIVEDQNFRYYSDTNGFGNIVQRTNKSTGEQQVYDYWSDGRIRKLTKYENVPTSTKTLEIDYFFDALGRRIAKKVKSRSREFTQAYSYLANQDKILFAKSGDDKIQMQVDGQGIDEHWAHITSSGIKTYISDHLGTVVNSEVTDENKITGAFGETLQDSPNFEFNSNPVIYGFTGRHFEPESGLYYYRNRSYDPMSGRFMTKDPKGISAGDVNLYRYVRNRPLSSTDPLGLVELPGDYGASTLNTDQGIGMLIDSYVNEAANSPIGGQNIYQTAHGNAQDYRNSTGDNSLALSSAEHYLWTRGEVQAGGMSEALIQTTSTLLYTPAKAAAQSIGLYEEASPASMTQMEWGLKGVSDAVCK